MNIAIDLDEILADYLCEVVKYYNSIYNTTWKKSDFFSYKFWEVWGGSKEDAIKIVFDFFQSPYFQNIKPIAGAIKAIDELNHHKLYVITARPDDIKKETAQWLEKYFPNVFSGIYLANHYSPNSPPRKKSVICDQLSIDLIIDDYPEYLIDCHKVGRRSIIFNYPWNAGQTIPDTTVRVNNWEEALRFIKTIE